MVAKNHLHRYKEKPIEQGTIDKVLFDICLENHQLYNQECNQLDIHRVRRLFRDKWRLKLRVETFPRPVQFLGTFPRHAEKGLKYNPCTRVVGISYDVLPVRS